MFGEKAATFSMTKHGMEVIKKAIQFLNPGQIPVMECDQPLFALAKYVQWLFPTILGERLFVVTFGQLHLEAAFLSAFGDLLDGSGWISALVQAEVATSGTANSFLKASHITRTRHAHQVTLLALFELRKRAFMSSGTSDFQVWLNREEEKHDTFMFWNLILDLQTELMIYVRSIRTSDFILNVTMIEKLSFLAVFGFSCWIVVSWTCLVQFLAVSRSQYSPPRY
eukprot:Lithocolla_globosa_v1_NODE_4732_length_1377_cov_11.537415.p1 type:complete len:225 gc:universal NODE_4732_length_1377_cov_11.537415:664-1338(+)